MKNQYSKIELSRNELKVLRYLRIPISHISRVNVTKEVISNRLRITPKHGEYIIQKLLNLELITRDPLDTVGHGPATYLLSDMGTEYLHVRVTQTLSKLIWSLLVPIIASIIASTITTLLINK